MQINILHLLIGTGTLCIGAQVAAIIRQMFFLRMLDDLEKYDGPKIRFMSKEELAELGARKQELEEEKLWRTHTHSPGHWKFMREIAERPQAYSS